MAEEEKALVPAAPTAPAADDFEQRFLALAHKSSTRLTIATVAYELKLPTTTVEAKLEDLAARDVIVRDVDDEGNLFFRLPGGGGGGGIPGVAMAPASTSSINGLLVNFVLPGVGSLMNQKTGEGIGQLALLVGGIGALVTLHWWGLVFIAAAWIWGVVTGIRNLGAKK